MLLSSNHIKIVLALEAQDLGLNRGSFRMDWVQEA